MALLLASVAGMIWRFAGKFLPGGQLVKIVSNLAVSATILILAFSVIFGQISLSLLTSNFVIAFILFLGLGYAAASLIMELFGM